MIGTWLCNFGKSTTKKKILCPSKCIMAWSSWYQYNLLLRYLVDHLAHLVSAGFLLLDFVVNKHLWSYIWVYGYSVSPCTFSYTKEHCFFLTLLFELPESQWSCPMTTATFLHSFYFFSSRLSHFHHTWLSVGCWLPLDVYEWMKLFKMAKGICSQHFWSFVFKIYLNLHLNIYLSLTYVQMH